MNVDGYFSEVLVYSVKLLSLGNPCFDFTEALNDVLETEV
jgi:hypothetical protein